MWLRLEKQLATWDAELAKRLRDNLPAKIRQVNHAWVKITLPQIEREEEAVSKRLQKLEDLITKTKMLLGDVNQDLCRELTAGESLEGVRKFLLERFGPRLEKNKKLGRKIIRRALEHNFNLDRAASRTLFALLEEMKIVHYEEEPDTEIKAPSRYISDGDETMDFGSTYFEPVWIGPLPFNVKVFWEIG
jgi:hypothetical protein